MKIISRIIKKSQIIPLLIASLLVVTVSCTKNKDEEIDFSTEEILSVTEDIQKSEKIVDWNQNVKDFIGQICIVFGYGFNDDEYVTSTIKDLKETFGDTDQGELLYTIVFPGDVKNRVMNLYDLINEKDIKGLLILGAPQNTHFMVAKIQDYWEQEVPYPIFSFFPKDDVLGQQGTCNFILETQQTTEDETPEATKEMEKYLQKESLDLLKNSIHFIVTLPAPLPLDSNLMNHVEKIAGNKKIRRYQDPETGIKTKNHFILE